MCKMSLSAGIVFLGLRHAIASGRYRKVELRVNFWSVLGAISLAGFGLWLIAPTFSIHREDAQQTSDFWLMRTWNLDYMPVNTRNYARFLGDVNLPFDPWQTFHGVGTFEFIRSHQPEALSGNLSVTDFVHYGRHMSMSVDVDRGGILELPVLFYPGYRGFINGKRVPVFESANGFVAINLLNPGRVNVEIKWGMSEATQVGAAISSIAVMCLIGYGARQAFNRHQLSERGLGVDFSG